jgi:hypothetical protein
MVRPSSRDAGQPEISTFTSPPESRPADLYADYIAFLRSTASRLILVDLSSTTLPPVPFCDISALAKQVAQIERWRGRGDRSAIVCAQEGDYGLARVFVSLVSAEDDHGLFAVFRQRDSAKAWLRAGLSPRPQRGDTTA